jgi:predicted CoA-substrate-specific enzyme activase
MNYYAGIDGGSTYLKAVLIDQDGTVVDTVVSSTGIDNSSTVEKMLSVLTKRARIARDDIKYIMSTGYSRKVLEVADDDVSEITAHAYGVRLTAPPLTKPSLVIDIGGQDSKLIYLDRQGRVRNFTMNDKCAAGTGKFLEVMAEMLETTIEKIGPLSLESSAPCDINSMCVIFAQSEVVSLVARKFDRKDILSGVHVSMAKRIGKMTRKSEINGDIIMTGGGALNVGLHKAFEDELMADIHVANYPQYNGSLGAALIGKERAEKANARRLG